jgi:hypothetical protein
MEDSRPFSWLDLIDESMCHLPPTAYTDLVAEAHLLLQDVLGGLFPIEELLNPIPVTSWRGQTEPVANTQEMT